MALGSTQLLTEMSIRSISWGYKRPVVKADNFTAILCRCYVIWEPQHHGTLWVPRASNGTDLLFYIQGESFARGPKLLSIETYVTEIMTWTFICTYRERSKTGPAHNRCWNWSPFTSKHTGIRFSKFWNTFPKVSNLTAWISWRIASLSCSMLRGVFLYTLPFNRPPKKEVGRL